MTKSQLLDARRWPPAAGLLAGCAARPAGSIDQSQPFGATPDGRPVDIYTLHNAKGAEARIMTYGGIIVSLKMPDKSGAFGRRGARATTTWMLMSRTTARILAR